MSTSTTTRLATLAELDALVGSSLGTSSWFAVEQDRINTFADATDDHQWIHIDPERAKSESPFGGPIAHGYLTLSLIIPMWDEVLKAPHTAHTSNPVPFVIAKAGVNPSLRSGGALCDVAPTILGLMGLSPSLEMTGRDLRRL